MGEKYSIINGPASCGKTFFFDNNQKYFINSKNDESVFPENYFKSRGVSYFFRFNQQLLLGYIFEKHDNRFEAFIPDDYEKFFEFSEDSLDTALLPSDEYDFSNSEFVLLVRDPRIIWLVDDHYNQITRDLNEVYNEFINDINHTVLLYNSLIKSKIKLLVVKFEEYQSNFEIETQRILDFLELKEEGVIRSSTLANYYLSSIDFFQKYNFTSFYKQILSRDSLKIINKSTEEYNEIFNYDLNLSIEKITEGLNLSFWEKRDEIIEMNNIIDERKSLNLEEING